MNLHGDMIYVCLEQGKESYFKLSLPVIILCFRGCLDRDLVP